MLYSLKKCLFVFNILIQLFLLYGGFMKFLDSFFHVKERGGSIKNEIIGGLITFVAMCYILPINSSILSDAGMSSAGVFIMTAILSFVVTLIMGLVANYPISLSAGMGLNAFLAYTLCGTLGFSWQEAMILLTIAGILFFVLSLTPVRKIIIESIPKDIKIIIAASLGAFICFVGLKNSGVITSNSSTFVELNTFVNPAVLISFVSIVLCFGLMFCKNKIVKSLAVPISIAFSAIVGIIVSEVLIGNNLLSSKAGQWIYSISAIDGRVSTLPIFPTHTGVKFMDFSGVKEVFFFGALNESSSFDFGKSFVNVISNPASYVAIFSLIFVNLFDTTATLLAVGRDVGIINSEGKMENYQRAVLADATGALICGPLGTSTVTSFAESGIGVSLGAKTGLAAVVSSLMFLLSIFIYPIFSIFTYGSVTAPALVCVGAMIFVNNIKDLDWKNPIVGFTAFITIIFALLTYSIANGIGIGLITYTVMMLFARKHKEVGVPIYVIACLFLLSFALQAVLLVIK